MKSKSDWIRTPFAASLKYGHTLWSAEEELTEIRSDSSPEMEFNKTGREELLLRRQQQYESTCKCFLTHHTRLCIKRQCCSVVSLLLLITNMQKSWRSKETLEANLTIHILILWLTFIQCARMCCYICLGTGIWDGCAVNLTLVSSISFIYSCIFQAKEICLLVFSKKKCLCI
jgi:hypothetical protein